MDMCYVNVCRRIEMGWGKELVKHHPKWCLMFSSVATTTMLIRMTYFAFS